MARTCAFAVGYVAKLRGIWSLGADATRSTKYNRRGGGRNLSACVNWFTASFQFSCKTPIVQRGGSQTLRRRVSDRGSGSLAEMATRLRPATRFWKQV